MNEHQENRNQFIESNPGIAETKTWPRMWRKLFEEGREALHASFIYARHPTPENKFHLGEELVDMVFVIIDMASHAGVNMDQQMRDKLKKDTKRFPPGSVMRRKDYGKRKILLGERRNRFFRINWHN